MVLLRAKNWIIYANQCTLFNLFLGGKRDRRSQIPWLYCCEHCHWLKSFCKGVKHITKLQVSVLQSYIYFIRQYTAIFIATNAVTTETLDLHQSKLWIQLLLCTSLYMHYHAWWIQKGCYKELKLPLHQYALHTKQEKCFYLAEISHQTFAWS